VKSAIPSVAACLSVALLSGTADACPTCRSALSQSGTGWAHGFALSIAVLLGVLAIAAGTFGFAVWRATRGPR
jgi:hypothetical protein